MTRVSLAGFACLLMAACGTGSGGRQATAPPEVRPAPKITQFYASPAVVAPEDRTLLCYGVEGADEVTLTPPVEPVRPALSRCIEAWPKSTTEYVLKATGKGGESEARVKVIVDPKAPKDQTGTVVVPPKQLIRYLVASEKSVAPGQPFTLCFGLAAPATVSLDPPLVPLPAGDRGCVNLSIQTTTTLTVTAKGANGAIDTAKLTIPVR